MRRWPDASRHVAATLAAAMLLATPVRAASDSVAEAIAARDHHDYPTAIRLLRSAVAGAPADADLLRVLGTTLAFDHRYAEALTVLNRARTLAPNDQDIAVALARTLLWSGDIKGAGRVARDLSTLDPANVELKELSPAIFAAERDGPRVALDLVETVSRVTIGGSHPHWHETVATLSVPIDARTTILAGADTENRSPAEDTRLSLRLDRRRGWGAFYLGVADTPSATFRERWSLAVGAVVPVKRYLQGSIELRRAHYALVDVTVVEPGVTLHSPVDRWALTVHSINLWGEQGRHHGGVSLRADVQPASWLRLSGGGATYADTEAGLTRRVDSGFVGVSLPITRSLTAQLVADREVRRTSYSRDGITVGLRWRFDR